MRTITVKIGERDCRLALNARALRLIKEQTGRPHGVIIQACLDAANTGSFHAIDLTDVTAVVWACANALRGQEIDYEDIEYDLDWDSALRIADVVLQMLADEAENSPLAQAVARTAERLQTLTGTASGPSESDDSA